MTLQLVSISLILLASTFLISQVNGFSLKRWKSSVVSGVVATLGLGLMQMDPQLIPPALAVCI